MMEKGDQEQMATLFVSENGEIAVFPERAGILDFYNEGPGSWKANGLFADGVKLVRWSKLSVPDAVAAGILRLIKERDEAATKLDHLRAEIVEVVKELPTKSPLSDRLHGVLFPSLLKTSRQETRDS